METVKLETPSKFQNYLLPIPQETLYPYHW